MSTQLVRQLARCCLKSSGAASPAVRRHVGLAVPAIRAHSAASRLARAHRCFGSTPCSHDKQADVGSTTPLGQIDPKMIIGFTCKVCNHRQHKYMSKKAYTKGVVLIRCDGCKNLHLIADNLGWYDSQKPPGTIEQIMESKGQKVHRARVATPTAQLPDDPAEIAKMHEADLLNEDNGMLEFLAKEQAQDGQRTAEDKGAEKESKP